MDYIKGQLCLEIDQGLIIQGLFCDLLNGIRVIFIREQERTLDVKQDYAFENKQIKGYYFLSWREIKY